MPRTPSPGLWFCNWKLWLGARQLLEAALAPLHLKPRDFWLLAIVSDAPVSQQELAAMCGVDPSSMVALLDELEEKGLVRRARNPRDRRVHVVSPTPTGTALYQQAVPLARKAEAKQLASLPAPDRRQLLRLLQALVKVA